MAIRQINNGHLALAREASLSLRPSKLRTMHKATLDRLHNQTVRSIAYESGGALPLADVAIGAGRRLRFLSAVLCDYWPAAINSSVPPRQSASILKRPDASHPLSCLCSAGIMVALDVPSRGVTRRFPDQRPPTASRHAQVEGFFDNLSSIDRKKCIYCCSS